MKDSILEGIKDNRYYVLVYALISFIFLYYLYPGRITPDVGYVIAVAQGKVELSNIFPVLFTLVYKWLYLIAESIKPYFVICFGLHLLTDLYFSLRLKKVYQKILFLILSTFNPVFLNIFYINSKDALNLVLFKGLMILIEQSKKIQKFKVFVYLLCSIFVFLRFTNIFFIPFFMYLFGEFENKKAWGLILSFTLVIKLGLSFVSTKEIYPSVQTMLHDIITVNDLEGLNTKINNIYPQTIDLKKLKNNNAPDTSVPVIFAKTPLNFPTDKVRYRDFVLAWVSSIIESPWSYIKHRTLLFAFQIGVKTPYSEDHKTILTWKQKTKFREVFQNFIKSYSAVFFIPIIYYLFLLLVTFRYNAKIGQYRLLYLFMALELLSLFFLAPATQFRYLAYSSFLAIYIALKLYAEAGDSSSSKIEC